MGFKKSENVLI